LLDLTLPDMDGFQVLREMQTLAPHLPVLLMSGYSAHDVNTRCRGAEYAGFLPKPFDAEQLVEACRGVLRPTSHTGLGPADPSLKPTMHGMPVPPS
jgi:DNA-binding response OmpR family regulator